MSDIQHIIKRYSIKHERTIKRICSPLIDYLHTPMFTYSWVNEDGTFGYLTNALEFNEYYFTQNVYLQNPYNAHPAHFRQGHAFIPCPAHEEERKILLKSFRTDHLFFTLEKNESTMEFFIFANENVKWSEGAQFLPRLELYRKFSQFFKREAKELLGKMRADRFNIRLERGTLFDTLPKVPLANPDPSEVSFLKRISGLSKQEQRCLDLFKKGHTAQSTAALMGLSRRTVEYHFENIKNKLGCYSKYDLLNY